MDRASIADLIVKRLEASLKAAQNDWRGSGPVRHFHVDDLLPDDLARAIRTAYPDPSNMQVKKSLRELKYVAAQMNRYAPLLEETLYAFQDLRVVDLIGRITGLAQMEPDEHLYAGGISMMSKGHFLNPHLDNSHDKERERYRTLNLLYYVSPDWELSYGGHLELWQEGPTGRPTTIESRFNRLVVMITNQSSWHSVCPVVAGGDRCCVSNYYFSRKPAEANPYFHVTSFRGRPEQRLRDLVLKADITLRMALRRLFPKGVVKNKHFYDRK